MILPCAGRPEPERSPRLPFCLSPSGLLLGRSPSRRGLCCLLYWALKTAEMLDFFFGRAFSSLCSAFFSPVFAPSFAGSSFTATSFFASVFFSGASFTSFLTGSAFLNFFSTIAIAASSMLFWLFTSIPFAASVATTSFVSTPNCFANSYTLTFAILYPPLFSCYTSVIFFFTACARFSSVIATDARNSLPIACPRFSFLP